MAQNCKDLTAAQCDWIIANKPNVPCQRYAGLVTKCRKKGGARQKMTPDDIAAFEAAQTAVPSGGILETVGGVVTGAAGLVVAPVMAAGQALGGVVTGAPAVAPAPLTDADLLTLSPFQISQITGMSVGQIRQLRASRFGYKPRRVSRRKRVSKRRKVSRKRRVSKRRKPVSKRRRSRKSKRRSSRRRSRR